MRRTVLFLLVLLPLAASAQTDEGAPVRELHSIVVFMHKGAPHYRVLHQTDQTFLRATAAGAIGVDGEGVGHARVIVSPDGRTEGTRGASVATTTAETPYRVLSLRDPIGGATTTFHTLEVQVCGGRNVSGTCTRWIAARPYPEGEPGALTLHVYDDPPAERARAAPDRMNPDGD